MTFLFAHWWMLELATILAGVSLAGLIGLTDTHTTFGDVAEAEQPVTGADRKAAATPRPTNKADTMEGCSPCSRDTGADWSPESHLAAASAASSSGSVSLRDTARVVGTVDGLIVGATDNFPDEAA